MENWENSTITESSTREKKNIHTANIIKTLLLGIFSH